MSNNVSNDYKSLVGLWKKLSKNEQRQFVSENVDGTMIQGKTEDDSLEKLKRAIDLAIEHRELPSIDFGSSSILSTEGVKNGFVDTISVDASLEKFQKDVIHSRKLHDIEKVC